MDHKAITALARTLSPHVRLGKARLETMSLIIVGMLSARTVNLSHLACERPGPTLVASTYRRLQRFFQYVSLDADWSARLIVGMLGLQGQWYLCLDRTNWKIGRAHVNLLVLAISTRRVRVPVLWLPLGRAGNSGAPACIALMQRYLALFGVGSIKMLLADREFIGLEWLHFLNENNIPFAIRMREGMIALNAQGHIRPFSAHLGRARGSRKFCATLQRTPDEPEVMLTFSAKRLKGGELLVVASNMPKANALVAYRNRWAIECLFGDAKTRGFNLEDTRLQIASKLTTLLALVALAIAWASKAASTLIGRRKLKRKSHGYYAKSWFRTGFDHIRMLLRTDPAKAIHPWLNLAKPRRVV